MARQPRHPDTPRQLSWSGLGWVALAAPALLVATVVAALAALPLAVGAVLAPQVLRQVRRLRHVRAQPPHRDATLNHMVRRTADLRQR